MGAFTAYHNGQWLPASQLSIALDDPGFMLGITVTERLRTFRGQLFRVDEHINRLKNSLAIVGLDAERVAVEIQDAALEFVERNRSLVDSEDDLSVVAFATPGPSAAGRPTACVHGFPLQFRTWASQFETGLPIVISDVRQVPNNCWPAELKCRSRMHFYLADREAAARRPGARAVLLDQDGLVAEATTANIVVYRREEGFISPPAKNILWGVSLIAVEELAAKLGIPFVRQPLTVEELSAADEAFLVSTSICALPVVQCDGKAIGNGRPGATYNRLMTAWNELVGLDIAAQARRFATRRA